MTHDEIEEAIERAAGLACKSLDEVFPGTERGGITSNFQGLLVAHIRTMLQGSSDVAQCYVRLPVLVRENTEGELQCSTRLPKP